MQRALKYKVQHHPQWNTTIIHPLQEQREIQKGCAEEEEDQEVEKDEENVHETKDDGNVEE